MVREVGRGKDVIGREEEGMRRSYGTKKAKRSKRTIAIASSILINNITNNKTTVGSCSCVVAVCGESHECPSQVWADTAAEVGGAV